MNTAKELEFLMFKFKEMSSKNTFKTGKSEVITDYHILEKSQKDWKAANKRIKVPRWMSKCIAEYDLANGYWTVSEAKT